MKKFTKILAVVMLVLMVAMTFASCGVLSIDLEKVAKRLEKKDYIFELEYYEDEAALYACDEDEEEFIQIIKYETIDDAKEGFDEMKEGFEEAKDYYDTDLTYGRKGKVVYAGTVKAVKDAFGFPANLLVFKK